MSDGTPEAGRLGWQAFTSRGRLIANAISLAERIMSKIDRVWPAKQ